jgi:hypothetical protein
VKLTGGSHGSVALATDGYGWEVLLGVLHDEEEVRDSPQERKEDGTGRLQPLAHQDWFLAVVWH